MSESLELLAPAADKSVAKAAIDCGADAVYMGAPRFGARVKAGNSVSDIAETVRYAHFYGAKVYVTLNTVLSDAEWPEANRIAWQCHEAGVDAFIIQDMAWLTADNRPPAVWHASTQCDIRTPEKARMLAEAGVSRLILARELSLAEIGAIHAAVPAVELEAFVHGALCVSYSGQCYLSEYLFGRSGNRGECAQACRLAYDLVNASGKRLAAGLHLLSLKDLALDAYVADMAARGIRSFKIEGRLKDICYVRNVTAHYRRVLDKVLAGEAAAYRRASAGRVSLAFESDLEKGFHRPYSTHFIDPDACGEKASLYTPKAMGEEIGRVVSGSGRRWLLETAKPLRSGDGLCFFDASRQLVGFGLNEVRPEAGGAARRNSVYIHAAKDVPLFPGAVVYRNQDTAFEKLLRSERAAERRVAIRGGFSYETGTAALWVRDEDGLEVRLVWPADYAAAENVGRMRENLRKQMLKTGEMPFEWTDFDAGTPPFIPIEELNARRRELLAALYEKRVAAHAVQPQAVSPVVPKLAAPPT
ncbi:MAG: U32 family peptidase, partial [Bacteroidales bacterium]|nr:U32 family peptidase [Bacteroidales bacterium]